MPNGWAASAGGFPAMTEKVAFLMKDFVLLAVSFYLFKQDLLRLLLEQLADSREASYSGEFPICPETSKRTHNTGVGIAFVIQQRYEGVNNAGTTRKDCRDHWR
jgi:Protein of unknown function, DUF417